MSFTKKQRTAFKKDFGQDISVLEGYLPNHEIPFIRVDFVATEVDDQIGINFTVQDVFRYAYAMKPDDAEYEYESDASEEEWEGYYDAVAFFEKMSGDILTGAIRNGGSIAEMWMSDGCDEMAQHFILVWDEDDSDKFNEFMSTLDFQRRLGAPIALPQYVVEDHPGFKNAAASA